MAHPSFCALSLVQQVPIGSEESEFSYDDIIMDFEAVGPFIKKDGLLLQYAYQNYDYDKMNIDQKKIVRAVVLSAVKNNGLALQFAPPSLTDDYYVVMAAVNKNGLALQFATKSLKKMNDVVMAAVQRDGLALKYAYGNYDYDKLDYHYKDLVLRVVQAAVEENGLALQFAPPSLKQDTNVVLAAVKNNGLALQFAHSSMKSNVAIAIFAVLKSKKAIEYVDESVKDIVENQVKPYK